MYSLLKLSLMLIITNFFIEIKLLSTKIFKNKTPKVMGFY